MRRFVALLGFVTFVAPLHAAPIDIGGGIEQFTWQEFDDAGSKVLKESGKRQFLSLESINEVSDRWTYGFRGRVYTGSVDCDGQLKVGSCIGTQTDYNGIAATVDFTGRFAGAEEGTYSNLGLRLGAGGEGWRRHILGINGYTEEYTVFFGKLGLAYTPEQGFFGDVGVKYPLSVHEDVKLYDHVSLSPQGAFSPFITVGYNFNQRLSVKGYYDGYRFKSSDPDYLYNAGVLVGSVHQPKSSMDQIGITFGFYF